jgi:tetratricopeptide (TPR) repeat protein
LIKPLTGTFDGGNEEAEAKPFYFVAEGKRRKGLYEEAIAEVRKQLEQFPGDHEGYMKLASIQMEDLKDLPAAQATLNEFLGLPGRAPNEMAAALHLLADWQLQFGRDAQAAIGSLQRIVQLYPGTSFAHAAEPRTLVQPMKRAAFAMKANSPCHPASATSVCARTARLFQPPPIPTPWPRSMSSNWSCTHWTLTPGKSSLSSTPRDSSGSIWPRINWSN